jgi:hypothetical protein
MKDFTIKDKCDKCGGTYDLDGVVYPNILRTGELRIEQATLCAVCREGFDKYLEDHLPNEHRDKFQRFQVFKEGKKYEKENNN